jgi:lycopene beta-cyclase
LETAQQYDYIIAGAGCAGLSLAIHLIRSGQFGNKRILLVDQQDKNKNDRTWCFWEKSSGLFQSIVYKEWKNLVVKGEGSFTQLDIDPYTYKLIRGIDFYKYCFEEINKQPNFTVLQGSITELVSTEQEAYVTVNGERITASYIFSSIQLQKPQLVKGQYWLLQHFKGWVIETPEPKFDPSSAVLMDFETDQSEGTTFFYVLPFTAHKALVEYTLFSEKVLPDETYERSLKHYVSHTLGFADYIIHEKEFGVIPMTNYSFKQQDNKIVYIGTAGGQTKASSGYTFRFIQKQSARIVQNLGAGKTDFISKSSTRFQYYDSVLLQILAEKKMKGSEIFTRLFAANKASKVFCFLDNETTIAEELPILKSLPFFTFLKAGMQELPRVLQRSFG